MHNSTDGKFLEKYEGVPFEQEGAGPWCPVWPDWAEIRPVGGIQHFWGGQNFGGAGGLFWAEFHLANFY